MLGDYRGIVEAMHEWLTLAAERDEEPPRHLVRFLAHLVLIIRRLNLGANVGFLFNLVGFFLL